MFSLISICMVYILIARMHAYMCALYYNIIVDDENHARTLLSLLCYHTKLLELLYYSLQKLFWGANSTLNFAG
jgi:hypothetical protein